MQRDSGVNIASALDIIRTESNSETECGTERRGYMALTAKQEYEIERQNSQQEVRKMVLKAVRETSLGTLKDFNEVCDRLEQKYGHV